MPVGNSHKYTPPYISPKAFHHLIEELEKGVPEQLDRTYLDGMFSGSTGTQVMAALRYLGLADNMKPTPQLRLLVGVKGEERAKRLRDIALKTYAFIFSGITSSGTATYGQLEDLFSAEFHVDGDVRRKCIKFFTSLAHDAGVPLSPHIIKRVRMTHGTRVVKTPARRASPKTSRVPALPQEVVKVPEPTDLMNTLVNKFPDYDIQWTDEQKQKWVDDFSMFVIKIYPEVKK